MGYDVKNLVEKLRACLGREGVAIADFLELLLDFDRERAWLTLGFPSLFEFCCEMLGLTAAEAANRIRLMNLSLHIPDVLPALRARRISATGLRFLAPLATPENFASLLAQVEGLSTRQIEAFSQEQQAPKSCVDRDQMTRVKSRREGDKTKPKPGGAKPTGGEKSSSQGIGIGGIFESEVGEKANSPVTTAAEPVAIEAPEYRYHFTISEEQRLHLERVKELVSHRCDPNKLAAVLDLLMEEFLNRHDPQRRQPVRSCQSEEHEVHEEREAPEAPEVTENPRSARSRHIPGAVRREVHVRDGGRCTYVDSVTGRRCSARRYLHIDHIVPFAHGGSSTNPNNLRLLCPGHNRLAADAHFGRVFMEEKVMQAGTSRDVKGIGSRSDGSDPNSGHSMVTIVRTVPVNPCFFSTANTPSGGDVVTLPNS